jgi:futalosine hydrolase
MPNLLIVAAVEAELSRLKVELDARPAGALAGFAWHEGLVGYQVVNLGVVGIGVASAGLGLGILLAHTGADIVIMTGSGGTFPGTGLSIGDVAVASSETFAELGICAGSGIGDARSLGLSGLSQEIPLDAVMARSLTECSADSFTMKLGRFLTVAGVSASERHVQRRQERFHPLMENMEGFALALASQKFGIRAGEVRGVSNVVGNRDKASWNLSLANERAQDALLSYLRRML